MVDDNNTWSDSKMSLDDEDLLVKNERRMKKT